MGKKASRRKKHVPQRTCVGCRETLAKRTLIRIVRSPDGVRVDRTGKSPGRGAYLHDRRACWEKALKGNLANALRTKISPQDEEALRAYLENLPIEKEDDMQE